MIEMPTRAVQGRNCSRRHAGRFVYRFDCACATGLLEVPVVALHGALPQAPVFPLAVATVLR